jgi:RHS repeat-associated protein
MFKGISAVLAAALILLQTAFSVSPAQSQSAANPMTAHPELALSLAHTTFVLDDQSRRASFSGLNVFLPDDYRGPLPVLVQVDCFGPPQTPPLAIDAAAYGANSRLLNLTRRSEHGCSSYQIATAAAVQPTSLVVTNSSKDASSTAGIAVSVHHSGLPAANGQIKDPAVFVFNPVHGNWTEAKSFAPSVQEAQRVYATLAEQHQRIIGGVIAVPEALQGEPARSGPSSLAKPLEQISPVDGQLAVDRIEPDSKGAYGINLPLLLRPSRGAGPSFSIRYSSQGAPGVLGRGWDLSISSIEVRGPSPIYHPDFETEDYLLEGMDLIALDANGKDIPSLYKGGPIIRRNNSGMRVFRSRNNSGGLIVRRHGDSPGNYYWEVWDPNSHITKLYGGEFAGEGKKPVPSKDGNGLLKATAKLGDGAQRAVIGQWSLTQEYDRQRARTGSSYFYLQTDSSDPIEPNAVKPRRECQNPGWNDNDCRAALRLDRVEYNHAFGLKPPEVLDHALTTVQFEWEFREWERINSDGRLGFFRAQEYWLKKLDVRYKPDPNNVWLAGTSPAAPDMVSFASHVFDVDKDGTACMNYDAVLRSYTVTPNERYDRGGLPASAMGEKEIELKEQTFSFDYEGQKPASSGDCAREWTDAEITKAGELPPEAADVGGQLGFKSDLLKGLGFGLLTAQSLLGTARTEETGASLYVGVGPVGDTSSKQITGGAKGGINFTRSEGNSTLVDVTGDGIDDIVFRKEGQLHYCPGRRNPETHAIEFPGGPDVKTSCGTVRGISEFSISSTSTHSFAAETSPAFSVFAGVGFNNSKNDSYVYFTDRDGDGLLDLVSYGRVFYGQGEDLEKKEVWFAPKSGLTPPIPGISVDDGTMAVAGTTQSNETKKKIDENKSRLGSFFPPDMVKTVKDIETRLDVLSKHLASLDYSQTTIAWEAPLTGVITIASGELTHGESKSEPDNLGPLGRFGPEQFEALFNEVQEYQEKYIDQRFNCQVWGEDHCYQIVSDPIGPHHVTTEKAKIEFLDTPKAKVLISLQRRANPAVTTCFDSGGADVENLTSLSFDPACKPGGKQIAVGVGDVLYLTYSIHPHLAKWRKPKMTIAYASVENDPVFQLYRTDDPKKLTDSLPCKWLDQHVVGRKVGDCLLSRQTRYTFDLRTGAIASSPSDSVELAGGSSRDFGGILDIPNELTADYRVFFDVVAKPASDRMVHASTAAGTANNIPASALGRLFRQDISAECPGSTGRCTARIRNAALVCESGRGAECSEFLGNGAGRYKIATRIAVEHRLTGEAIPVRNISARLNELNWRLPPHVSSVFTEDTTRREPQRITFSPSDSFDTATVVYLPVAMGEPDLEYVRIEDGTFNNPDVDLNEDDRTPETINFSQILSAERESVKLARSRQVLALCNFAKDIVGFLRNGYSTYDQPYADEYVDHWEQKSKPYEAHCAKALDFFNSRKFTKDHVPETSGPQMLRLPHYLRDLPYAEQLTSAETLFERVLRNLALSAATGSDFESAGGEMLTDHPRLTRRGYRLPVKVNPFDCKALMDGEPLEAPVMLPDQKCAYRLSTNFAMQELEDLATDVQKPADLKNQIAHIRKVMEGFGGTTQAAFTVRLTATINGRPAAFRELTGKKSGNEDCTPKTNKTCMGNYGTIEPASSYFYPTRKSGEPADRHGDVFPRVTANKRTGRAVAFSNGIMDDLDLTRCPRNYPHYPTLGHMETKQDCLFSKSDITAAEKYDGADTYHIDYEIGENNHFVGRNRVIEFDASPLDVLELRFRLAGVENKVERGTSKPDLIGKFSVFEPGQQMIPRSPSQILLPPKEVVLQCPVVPLDSASLPSSLRLPTTCRPWTRLGWTEVFLGAQYRTYSDGQEFGDPAKDRTSIKRRREILRLHPEIEVEADQYVLQDQNAGNLPTVAERKEDERYVFHSRDPNVAKTGGDWALFASRTARAKHPPDRPTGDLLALPPFFTTSFGVLAPDSAWSIRYGRFPERLTGQTDPYDAANIACGPADRPDFDTCEKQLTVMGQDVLRFGDVIYFPLNHRFAGPVTTEAFKNAQKINLARPETSVCAAESPTSIASCWKGADDTVFLERAIVTAVPAGSSFELYSVSALVGFERPPVTQFDYEFASYKKLACRDPEFPTELKEKLLHDRRPDIVEHCTKTDDEPVIVDIPAVAGIKFPNRPTPPKPNQTVEVFAPVQSSTSSSVSHNEGAVLLNTHSVKNRNTTIRQFRDVNGDGFPDTIDDDRVELTSPVGLTRRDWWQYFRVQGNEPSADFSPNANEFGQSANAWSSGKGVGLSASTAAKFLAKGTRSSTTGSSDPQVDPSFDLSLERGYDEEFTELRDFNGDGLADKIVGGTVGAGLSLQFNTGSSLRGKLNRNLTVDGASVSGFHFNTSHSSGFGVRLGYSYGAGSYGIGMGLAHRDAGSQAALMDFTGDGRPDIVLPHPDGSGSLMVFPNLGNGFGKPRIHKLKNWAFQPQAGTESGTTLSETTLVDGGLLYTYGVNLEFVRIVFTPGIKWGGNQTRELLNIRDVNGDGVPDLVVVGGNFLPSTAGGPPSLLPASLKTHAYYNPDGKYHLLTGIRNPSGSQWALRHNLYGNDGPQHGRAVWALTGVARYDGFEPQASAPALPMDGHDVLLTTYNYSGGYFNRAERQFYGFANRTSAIYGCDLAPDTTNKCLAVVRSDRKLDEAQLNAGGYRKLQVITQTFSNQDFLTQGVELARAVAGTDSEVLPPAMAEPNAISRNKSGYSIDNLASLTAGNIDVCQMSHAIGSDVSWDANSFKVGGSSLSPTSNGTSFVPNRKVFGPASVCGTNLGQCTVTLAKNMCDEGFVREQRTFWAQQSGSVRMRLSALETFGGNVPASELTDPATPPVERLRSAVAFDHDQWGQVLGFNSIGEADSEWKPANESTANAEMVYAQRQSMNAGGGVGYPMLGLAELIQVFAAWSDTVNVASPLRVREAVYSEDGLGNVTDVCLYPGGPGFTFKPGMCQKFKHDMKTALNDGYSSMQSALRSTYDQPDFLPKGQSTFNSVIHHQLLRYDEFGNLEHAVSPLSQNREWIERRFDFKGDPFRRTATTTELTRCVTDIPGAGRDSPDLETLGIENSGARCTYGLGAALPEPVLRKPITHFSKNRIDTHFGAVAETRDINGNSLLHDFDRWGRLSLIARSWGNAPRENRTFQDRLRHAVAKDETRKAEEAKDWRILAVADYERISDGQLRSNLRRFESSDSYAGLLGKDHTTRETALFSDGLGRPIQSIREADVCVEALPALIDGTNVVATATLAERCKSTATGIVTPSTRIDALGRDLESFESYPIVESDGIPPRKSSERRFIKLAQAAAKRDFLSRTKYDGAGRPLLVESRLSKPADETILGAAQYRYRIVPEDAQRPARFEALSVSPRCAASAIWSDARGLKRTVFEDQDNLYPGKESPPPPLSEGRDPNKTRGYCEPIESMAGRWSTASKDSEVTPGRQPSRVSYTYDPLQQLTGVDYPLADTERTAIAARFDLMGRTLEVQEPNSGCTRYGYDGLNLLISETGFRHEEFRGKPCGASSRVRNEKSYDYSGGRLVRMSYRSLEEQGGPADERDTVRLHYDRYPYAALFGEVLETLRFVPNDQANQRFVDVTGRKCDNCIGQVTMVSDRSGARGFSYNELGLARREVRSIVAPLRDVKQSPGISETYIPEIAFHEVESSYTAFGDPVQEKFAESAPMNPANACVTAGVETCLARFTTGRKYAPDGAVAQLLFNGKPLVNAAQDALGRPAVRWTSNGIATGYSYDALDLRLNRMTTLTAANMPVQANGYQYDGGGNILGYGNKASGDKGYENDFVFHYDPVNRLDKFSAEVSRGVDADKRRLSSGGTYTYDPGHRFTSRTLSIIGHPFTGDPGTAFDRKWAYSYGNDPVRGPLHAPNAIKFTSNSSVAGNSVRDHLFEYDDVGRMIRIGARASDEKNRIPLLSNRAMTWDAEGRLIRVRGVQDDSTEKNDKLLREDYVYDSGGNRTLKIYRPVVQDEKEKEAEYATIYMTPSYARPYDKRGAVQLSQGSLPAASLAPPADQSEDPIVTYLYSDLPVGSMTAGVTKYGEATDASATVIARREYTPYGLELTAGSLANTRREGVAPMSVFHGKELDRVTKFSLFGARSYSRDLGVWLRPDPMLPQYLGGAPNGGAYRLGNLALYNFVKSDPINGVDPTGLWGFGPVGSFSAEGGLAAGGGVTASFGGGIFWGGPQGLNAGGFASGGAFIGAPGYSSSYPTPLPGGTTGVLGAYAGAGAGGFVTNATNVDELKDAFNTYSINTPIGSAQLGVSGKTWIFSVTCGVPPCGIGIGAAISTYPTNTGVVPRSQSTDTTSADKSMRPTPPAIFHLPSGTRPNGVFDKLESRPLSLP